MSVLIKGIKKTDCGICVVGNRTICANGCRMVEVQPHGRLIDANVAYDKIAEAAGEGSGNYVDMDVVDRGLSETPTIIEAEE